MFLLVAQQNFSLHSSGLEQSVSLVSIPVPTIHPQRCHKKLTMKRLGQFGRRVGGLEGRLFGLGTLTTASMTMNGADP